jgi:hypothetical protein
VGGVSFPIAHGMGTPVPKPNSCFTICFLQLSYVDLDAADLLQFVLVMQKTRFDVQFQKTIISEMSPIHCHIPSSVLSVYSITLGVLVLHRLKHVARNILTHFTKLLFGKFPKNVIQQQKEKVLKSLFLQNEGLEFVQRGVEKNYHMLSYIVDGRRTVNYILK